MINDNTKAELVSSLFEDWWIMDHSDESQSAKNMAQEAWLRGALALAELDKFELQREQNRLLQMRAGR